MHKSVANSVVQTEKLLTCEVQIPSYTWAFKLYDFLGAFAKLRKATLASSCLPVRLEKLDSHWTDFYAMLYFKIFFF
jgi:hypothetical protein